MSSTTNKILNPTLKDEEIKRLHRLLSSIHEDFYHILTYYTVVTVHNYLSKTDEPTVCARNPSITELILYPKTTTAVAIFNSYDRELILLGKDYEFVSIHEMTTTIEAHPLYELIQDAITNTKG